MRSSQNLPLPPRIYPPLNIYMRPSQILPLSPKIYPPFPQLCATLPESTPPSQSIPLFSHLHGTLPESTPPPFHYYMRRSQNLPLPPRIYHPFQQLCVALPESALGWKGGGIFWEGGVYSGSVAHRCLKWGILWEGGLYYGSVAHSCEKGRYIQGERSKFWEGRI